MKRLKIIFSILVFSVFVGNVSAANIVDIIAEDTQTVKVSFSPDVTFPQGIVNGEVKVVKDLRVLSSERDENDVSKVTIIMEDNLEPDAEYSIISVGLAEGSIDFALGAEVGGIFRNNNVLNEEKIIERISISDDNTIEAYYNYEVTPGAYDFKVLSELPVNLLTSAGNNELEVSLNKLFDTDSSYILMISSLEDVNGNQIDISEILYDFYTPFNLESNIEVDFEHIGGEVVNENVGPDGEIITEVDGNSLEEVALNAAQQPNAGPTTWVLIILTLLIGATLFILKSKKEA